jgi:RNA polymerase sigma-70 factor (sigma-E family)
MPDSFEEYVTARDNSLLPFAYLVNDDHHLADLVQEVLARLHGRWRRLERDCSPGAHGRRAIVREFLSWRRRRSSGERVMATLPDQPDRPRAAPERFADQDEVWRWLTDLSGAQRAVIVLGFYEGLSDAQITDVLGCAQSTVRVHAARGLARLRASFPTYGQTGVGL